MRHTSRRVPKVCLVLFAVSLAACGTVTPGPGREIPTLGQPLLGDVTLVGLVFENLRESGYSTHTTVGSQQLYVNTQTSNGAVPTNGSVTTTNVATTRHFERYDDDSIQVALRYALEEKRVVRRFVPDAPLRIEGRRVAGGASTSAGWILWDVANTVTLLGLLPGLPYVGSQEAEVELRVYWDDALVRTYRGRGSASWSKNAWGIVPALGPLRSESLQAASAVATRNAVVALIEAPPELPAGE